ncbi:hypothetical protein LSAT2_006195 [Lamellibrachia satsuma]|nr:hypothetical protein LSAT2_006195 [Lamellibrachia satsuma]
MLGTHYERTVARDKMATFYWPTGSRQSSRVENSIDTKLAWWQQVTGDNRWQQVTTGGNRWQQVATGDALIDFPSLWKNNRARSLILTAISIRPTHGTMEKQILQNWSRLIQFHTRSAVTRAFEPNRSLRRSRRPSSTEKQPVPNKRGFADQDQSVCPSAAEWRQLYTAKDMNDTSVEVFQPNALSSSELKHQQWFYTVMCDNEALTSVRDCRNCCMGIDHTRFSSSCRQKRSFVMALVRRPWEPDFDWSWIQLETSCDCAIKSNVYSRFR